MHVIFLHSVEFSSREALLFMQDGLVLGSLAERGYIISRASLGDPLCIQNKQLGIFLLL